LDLINFLSHVMTFWRTTLNLSINNTKLKSEPIQIKRGIYQGDSQFHNQPKVTLKFTIYHRNILLQQSIKVTLR
jgi:hypothetical protein